MYVFVYVSQSCCLFYMDLISDDVMDNSLSARLQKGVVQLNQCMFFSVYGHLCHAVSRATQKIVL